MIDFDTHLALTRLYADYALAVDSGQWELWPDFFADDCSYRLQPRENYDRGFPLCTLAFSSKGMLRDRVYGIIRASGMNQDGQTNGITAPNGPAQRDLIRALAKRLDDVELAIIDKRRPRPNESKVMNIIGEVLGKTCVLIDDMVDTAGTLCIAAQALKDEGAVRVVAYITHPILSGSAVEKISKSALDQLVVTDTIPLSPAARQCPQIRQLSVAGLLGETIRRIRDEESVSSLYVD